MSTHVNIQILIKKRLPYQDSLFYKGSTTRL